jgi:PhnB protein
MAVKAIPDGYHSVTPYLIVKGADRAIDFYKKVFGASERMRMDGPNGTVGHAEIEIDGSAIMLADEFPDMGFRSPQSLGGAGVSVIRLSADRSTMAVKMLVREKKKKGVRAVTRNIFEQSQISRPPRSSDQR